MFFVTSLINIVAYVDASRSKFSSNSVFSLWPLVIGEGGEPGLEAAKCSPGAGGMEVAFPRAGVEVAGFKSFQEKFFGYATSFL